MGDTVGAFRGLFDGGLEAAFVEVGAEAAGAVVDGGTLFEAFEEFVFPDVFVENRVDDEVMVVSPAGAEAGGGGEGIEFGGDGSTRFVEGGEHGAADIGGVGGGDDGILDGDDPADGGVGGGGTSWAGVGHDGAAADDGGAEELGHF